jgi:hypothetical protein
LTLICRAGGYDQRETMPKSIQLANVQTALAEVRQAIGDDKAPRSRALRVKLETYERVLHGWHDRTPGHEQYRSLFECVQELREEVLGNPGDDLPASARPTEQVPCEEGDEH